MSSKWTDTFSLYGSYSQSLKPSSSIAPMTGYIIDGATPPEEATAWEVGGKLDLPGGMTGTLALFNIDKKNVLVSQYNDATKLTDWRTSGRRARAGSSRRVGQDRRARERDRELRVHRREDD